MITQLFRRAWIHLLIAFSEKYTLEGFERTQRKFECPENSSMLDSRSKREVTICNLFANQNQSLWNISRVLDVSVAKVVVTLIEHGLINERRVREARTKYERRQKPLSAQPMEQTHASEVPAQFELPISMSTWVTTSGLKSGSPVGRGSVTARRLAS